MLSLTRSLRQPLAELYHAWPDQPAEEILRAVVDSELINQPALADAHRFCLVRLADDWSPESIQHLLQLFYDALDQPDDLLRFHSAQAIGELTGRHGLNLFDQARRFIRRLNQPHQADVSAFFGYLLNGFQRECRDSRPLLELEEMLRPLDQTAWLALVFQLPEAALHPQHHAIARTIQSLDGLRLLQRLHRSGYPLDPPKASPSVLVQYERMAPGEARDAFVDGVRSSTQLMIEALTDTAPAGLKHSTIDFLADRARLDRTKRAYNTVMHLVQVLKLDRDIATGLHARDSAIELLSLLKPSEIDRLVIELRNSLGQSSSTHQPAIPRLLAESLLKSPAKRWNHSIDALHEMIKLGHLRQAIAAIHTIYYLLERSHSRELQSQLLLCLLSGVAHHRDELAIISAVTIAQLVAFGRLDPAAFQPVLRKLWLALNHRLSTSPELAYFYQPIRKIFADWLNDHPELADLPVRPCAFFPGSFDPFSLGHEAVAKAVARLGYDVYLAIDEFSWSKRTQPNRIRREILRLSIADELHLYEFPESISVNLANDRDLNRLRSVLGEDVALIVGEDVIRGASAYRRAGLLRQFHHLVFARQIDSDISALAERLGLSIELIPLSGFESVSSSLIRSSLDSMQDISQLIDPLARRFIYDYDAYKHRQLTKDALILQEPSWQLSRSGDDYQLSDPAGQRQLSYTEKDDQLELTDARGDCFDLICDVLADASRRGIARAVSQIELPDLSLIGFVDQTVDLSQPCSLHFDLDDLIKDDYRQDERFRQVLNATRRRLLREIGRLYPGQFILPLYQHRVYHKLAQLITQKNGVPLEPSEPRELGPYLCVPYGEILKKRVLPNTVTKSLHTEKFFASDLTGWQIEESPQYMTLAHQMKMIDSFDRPVLLVDDLLNKGYRLKRLMPLFKDQGIELDTLYLGLISRRGRAIADDYALKVEAAYELPQLRHWFAESKCYPYLGGDSVADVKSDISAAFWPSINLIYPYNRIPFLHHLPIERQYDFSAACIDNAIELLEVLETIYQDRTYRHPQLRHLPEWIYQARYPYYGRGIVPEESLKPSRLLRQDREWLERMR